MKSLVLDTSYDESVDAAYISFNRTEGGPSVRQVIVEDEQLGNMNVILDVDSDGKLLGIELLDVSTLVAAPRFRA
jgi:uncharacterized protein YuzE